MGAAASITPGKILSLYVCFPREDQFHNKLFVVVGLGESPLLLKINTSHEQTDMGKKFSEFQFKIQRSTYPFLDHDSHLDCGTVWILLTAEEVIEQITKDPRRIKGDISEDHKNEIIRLVEKSRSISPKHKSVIRQLRKK